MLASLPASIWNHKIDYQESLTIQSIAEPL